MGYEILNQLNPAQQEACLITEGPLLILAGAGSGKTRVLTYRAANLIYKGVPAEDIMAITFTNKAAAEMKERITNLIPQGKKIWVSTFHSACVRILRMHIHMIGYQNQFTIYDADDSLRNIKNCIKSLNLSEKMFPARAVMNSISKFKDRLLPPEDAAAIAENFHESESAKVYALYQKILKTGNSLDFDDIISKAVELFTVCPDILDRYQESFRYIMVDEYQDTNTAQYHFVRMLAEKYRNICVVGDDDQSIYGWRGANIKNILDFEKEYPDAAVVKLEQNYRSTKTILDCANSVIKNNGVRTRKKLWTAGEAGEKVTFYCADNDYEESRFITSEIKKMTESGNGLADFAVLYRVNATSRVLEEAFIKNSLPYKVFGGVNFYSRREIKDILAYLKLIYNRYDALSFERIINVPRRGIGDTTVDRIRSYANEHGMYMFDAATVSGGIEGVGKRSDKILEFVSLIETLTLAAQGTMEELIRAVISATNYDREIILEDETTAKERLENIDSLISKAHEYDEKPENTGLAGFLEEISLVADIDSLKEGDAAVSLMTLHNCKGLEFSCVFIAGFEEGLIPGYRSLMSGQRDEVEEERRICYVGITRAMKKLYLTCAKRRMHAGTANANPPSRFLDEIDQSLIETSGFWDSAARDKKFPSGGAKPTDAAAHVYIRPDGRNISSAVPQTAAQAKSGGYQSYKFSPPKLTGKNTVIDFETGDTVSHIKFGTGEVLDIRTSGSDYEITVKFQGAGIKKVMACFARLKKV